MISFLSDKVVMNQRRSLLAGVYPVTQFHVDRNRIRWYLAAAGFRLQDHPQA